MKHIKKCILIVLTLAIFVSTFAIGASAAGKVAWGAATVSATSLNVRKGPGVDYDRVTTLAKNERVVVLEKTNSDWWLINFCGYEGYVSAEYMTDDLKAENFKASGTIKGDGVRLRTKPNTNAKIVNSCSEGFVLPVVGINNGWYKVITNGDYAYVRSDFMDITGTYDGAITKAKANSEGQKIVNEALQHLGKRYVYGAEGPNSFDCSGLVYYVYKTIFGYDVERTASQQYKHNGVSVSKDQLQPGDLVFFSSNGRSVTHVGIYISDNEFIHASTSDTGVIKSNLTTAYYTRVWFGAKRIVEG